MAPEAESCGNALDIMKPSRKLVRRSEEGVTLPACCPGPHAFLPKQLGKGCWTLHQSERETAAPAASRALKCRLVAFLHSPYSRPTAANPVNQRVLAVGHRNPRQGISLHAGSLLLQLTVLSRWFDMGWLLSNDRVIWVTRHDGVKIRSQAVP